tara:strand:+ start:1087 stop:1425 length:339 start_codon:yes stop_codon:yes gene_type:complete
MARRPKNARPDFNPTTEGMGRNEMQRRTQQHNILATKKYETFKKLDLGVDAKWVNKHSKGNEMNPWVMKNISRMVGQQSRANKSMQDALKMWDTASQFKKTNYPNGRKGKIL